MAMMIHLGIAREAAAAHAFLKIFTISRLEQADAQGKRCDDKVMEEVPLVAGTTACD